MLLGRESLKDPILYTSKESHLSIFKAAKFFRMKYKIIPCQENQEIDYDALDQELSKHKDVPAIINLNIGTTTFGSIDNVDKVVSILKRNGFKREQYFIHCDGELFSMLLSQISSDVPETTFKKPIDCISISGHKFLGCPNPSGVVITYKKLVKNLEQHIAYLNSIDTTITGSRNGQAALAIWYSLREKGRPVYLKEVKQCLENAQYLVSLLKKEGISAKVYPNSYAVIFDQPKDKSLIMKWQLICKDGYSVASIMPNITKTKIDQFFKELKESKDHLQSKL